MKEGQPFSMTEGVFMNLGERTFWLYLYERLSVAVGFLVLAVALSLIRSSSLVPFEYARYIAIAGVILWLLFFVTLAFGFVAARLIFKNNSFCFDKDAFKIRRGVFTKIEMAIPYRQVQNVEIERTLGQRMLGVSKIVIITAGTDDPTTPRNESSSIMPVIDKEIAAGLQDELLRRADVQKIIRTA